MQNSFPCPKCGTPNRIGEKSCKRCGMVFQYYCPQCRASIKCNDPACTRCGNQLNWPSGNGDQASDIKQQDKAQGKQGKASWVGPFVGLIIVIVLAAAAYYVFIKLPELQRVPIMAENLTSNKKQEAAPVDKQPPVISGIQVNYLSSNSVEIRWVTDEPSTTQIIWHPQNGVTNTTQQKEAMVNQHSVELDTLKSKTTYYFQVRSVDQSGNEALSVEKSFDIGKPPVLTGVEVAGYSMSIEEKPPITGIRTYIRGQVRNTGDGPLNINNIEVAVKFTVPGTVGSSQVLAVFDPYPVDIGPGETHKFYAIVPNGTNPDYTVSARILNQ
jgi:hypothetical protein